MSERKQLSRKDGAGLLLFAVGSLGAVVMFLTLKTESPLPAQGPLGSFAELWAGSVGVFPAIFLNGAFMFLAFRMFVLDAGERLGRNLLASVGVTLALSVLVGAFSRTAGGVVGERTGWFVADKTHLAVGVLLGLVAVFAAVWFGWIRATNVPPVVEDAGEEPSAVSLVSKTPAKTLVRPAVHKTTAANEGVSSAEVAALFPDEDEVPVVRKLEPAEVARIAIPPSPYPEDVRRKGQIPAGAKPIEDANARVAMPDAPAAPVAPNVYHFPAARPAAAESVVDTTRDVPSPLARREDEDADARASNLDVLDVDEEAGAPTRPTASWESGAASFQPEAGDEEPVDAYGTPLSLVEELRRARRATGLEGERVAEDAAVDGDREVVSSASVVEDVRLTEFPGESDEDVVATAVVVDEEIDEEVEEDLFDDADDDAADDEDVLEDDEEPVAVAGVDEDADEGAVEDEGEGDEDDADLEPDADEVLAQDDEDEFGEDEDLDADEVASGDDDEVDDEAEDDDEAAAAELEPTTRVAAQAEVPTTVARANVVPRELDADTGGRADQELAALDAAIRREQEALAHDAAFEPKITAAPAASAEASAPAEASLPETVLVPEMNPAKGRGAGRAKEAAKATEPQPSLFDAVEAPAAEREVVLQPMPTVPADRTPQIAARSELDPRLAQLQEIGCLFVERGRVAVSMLQRQYEMDFDAACKVLDDLQEMGLIGPYLGGQRRDILLTREQWLERVSQAAAAR